MKRIIAAASAMLIFTACSVSNDIRLPDETDSTEFMTEQPTESIETELTEITVDNSEMDKNENVLTTLGTYTDGRIKLIHDGIISGGGYSGRLFLRSEDNKGNTISEISLVGNDPTDFFYINAPENTAYGLREINSCLIAWETGYSEGKQTRLFEVEADGRLIPFTYHSDESCSEFVYEDCLITSCICSNNSIYAHYDSDKADNDSVQYCYDLGNRRYTEYLVDLEENTVYVLGSYDCMTDNEITSAIEKWDARSKLSSGQLWHTYLNEYFVEVIGEDSEREETYKLVPPEIASTSAELEEYIRSAYSARYNEQELSGLHEELFGGDYPPFYEDERGLVYAESYRGVPYRFNFDTVRVISHEKGRARAMAIASGVDDLKVYFIDLVNEKGVWLFDGIEDIAAPGNTYYCQVRRKSNSADGCWLYLCSSFVPSGHKAGEKIDIHFNAVSSLVDGESSMLADENGNAVSYVFYRYDEEPVPLEYGEKTITLPQEGKDEYIAITPKEKGKYYFAYGAVFVAQNGERYEVSSGPVPVWIE